MKKSILTSLCAILGGAFLCILLCGCENFLKGEAVKNEIEKQIFIANNECPEATLEEPAFSNEGVEKNKAIKVSFTLPIDPDSFLNSFDIVDSQGASLKAHFVEPKWDDEYKLVTIAADENNYIDLKGKKTMDVYFTLSKNCKTKDGLPIKNAKKEKYRVNDNIDNTPPTLHDGSITRPGISVFSTAVAPEITLVAGELSQNEAQILNTNHCNSTLVISVEGSDYGGGRVSGHISYQNICNILGQDVSEQESTHTDSFDLKDKNEAGNYTGTYTLNLSGSAFPDGLYKIALYIEDSSTLLSNESKVYYVVKDTHLEQSIAGRLNCEVSMFRQDALQDYNQDTPTVEKIEWARNTYHIQYIADDVYYSYKKKNENGTLVVQYKNSFKDYKYYFSCGIKKDGKSQIEYDSTTPMPRLLNPIYTEGEGISGSLFFDLPDDMRNYISSNEDKDVILHVDYVDAVGNMQSMDAVIPKKPVLSNYTVTGSGNNKTITLNYADYSGDDYTSYLNIPGIITYVKYRVFYGEAGAGTLTRNIGSSINPQDPWTETTDSKVISGLSAGNYVVYIQTVYELRHSENWELFGHIYSSLAEKEIDTSKSGTTSLANYTPSVSIDSQNDKISAGPGTSLYNLTLHVTPPSSTITGLKYIPCFKSPDRDWVYFDAQTLDENNELTISVVNPLRAPLDWGESWSVEEWDKGYDNSGDNNYIQAVKNCRKNGLEYPAIEAKVKIIAVTGTETKESDEVPVTFIEGDDNIPPSLWADLSAHDSKLSYDGHSFLFTNLVREDEGHLAEFFNYYMMPYNDAWGDSLDVATQAEIEALAPGIASYSGSCWLGKRSGEGGTEFKADYRLDLSIPVNGAPDGKYMVFAKPADTYGNETFITLGKISIGTFKNKLTAGFYDDRSSFKAKLQIEPDESFDRNMISFQHIGIDGENGKVDKWHDYYGYLNELQNCVVKTEDGKSYLYFDLRDVSCKTANLFLKEEEERPNDPDTDTYMMKIEPEYNIPNYGTFCRATVQSFNQNTAVVQNNKIVQHGVCKEYGRPYYKPSFDGYGKVINKDNCYDHDFWVEDKEQETAYDVCSDETVSNTVYFYITDPSQTLAEYLEGFESVFSPSHLTVYSNKRYLINVISSQYNLGNDPDEWERRGNIVKTHYYDPHTNDTEPEKDENDNITNNYCAFNPKVNPFTANTAFTDMMESNLKGFLYYAAVVHFADGSSAVSDVQTIYCF